MKIIYAGTPEFAVPALETLMRSEHQVVAVYTQPDRRAGRGQKIQPGPVKIYALEHNIPVYQPVSFNDSAECKQLAGLGADLMVVAAYGLLLPLQVLEIPRLGCINIHASLLSRWRGAAPIQRAILAGDEHSGITIMQMDEGLDTGDILKSQSIEIGKDWTSSDLHDHLKLLGAQLVIEALEGLESGQLEALPQDHEGSCYAPRLSKLEAKIDWNSRAETLEREIRAFIPWPVSFTQLNDKNLRIWKAQVDTQYPPAKPGEIIEHNRDGIFVSCNDSVLKITQLQLAGKSQTQASQLLNSWNLTGMRFS